jgi:hypothetical protein
MGIDNISIQLTRPSGVYYANESVHGTVTLSTSSPISCRGFQVRFDGLAQVHWHTGSRDTRSDYYGKMWFSVKAKHWWETFSRLAF